MRENNRTFLVPSEQSPLETDRGTFAELLPVIRGTLRRHRTLLVLVTVLVFGTAAVYCLTATPVYKATATIAIDPRKFQLFQQPTSLGELSIESLSQVESQAVLIKSDRLALQVIDDLHLVGSIPVPPQPLDKTLPDNAMPTASGLDVDLRRGALDWFQSRLTVNRIGSASMLEIGFEAASPDRAAEIANSVADAYVKDELETKYEATRRGSQWLENRLKELREKSLVAAQAVVEFKARNNIIDTGAGQQVNGQQLADLNGQFAAARMLTAESKARLERIAAIGGLGDAAINSLSTGVITSEQLTKLNTRYSELSSRAAEYSAKYGDRHLAVIELRNQLALTRAATLDEIHHLAASYKSDYELALKRENALEGQLRTLISESEATSVAQVSLHNLENAAQTSNDLYVTFQKRFAESLEQQSFPLADASVVSRAVPPSVRQYKPLLRTLVLIFGSGFGLAFGIIIILGLCDRTFRTVSQVETHLPVSCIGVVPSVTTRVTRRLRRKLLRKPIPEPIATIVHSPVSAYAEAIRSIKVAIDLNPKIKPIKVIGITSSIPKEGKSTIAASLALCIRNSNARVILLDCDLRNPSLTRMLAPKAASGFLEVLSGKTALGAALCATKSTPIPFLPAVASAGTTQSSEILASKATAELFELLRKHYDYIVVDLPPLAPVVDARVTEDLVDSYVFVIKWGATEIGVVDHALAHAPNVAERVIGVVLNQVDMYRLTTYDHTAEYYNPEHYEHYRAAS